MVMSLLCCCMTHMRSGRSGAVHLICQFSSVLCVGTMPLSVQVLLKRQGGMSGDQYEHRTAMATDAERCAYFSAEDLDVSSIATTATPGLMSTP